MTLRAFPFFKRRKPEPERTVDLPAAEVDRDALLSREERFQAMFLRGPDGIVLLDPVTTRFLEFNDQACLQLGYTREAFQNLTLADIEAQEGPEEIARQIRRVLKTGSADFDTRHRTRDGELRDVHVTAQWIQVGSIRAYHCVWRDITERNRSAEALRETNRRLELAITSGGLGVWDRNLLDGTEAWNDRLYEIYGLAPQNPHPGYDFWCRHILHPEDLQATQEAIQAAIAGTAPYDMEFRILHPSRRIRHIKSNGLVLRDGAGKAVRIIGINRDLTQEKEAAAERQRLEMQLLHAQKMESLGSLAGGMAHDINNVLAAILGLASAHLDAQPPDSPLGKALHTICSAADRGGKMVKNLLAFSRQTPVEETAIDVNVMLAEQAGLLERTTLAKIRLQMDLDSGLRPTLGDPGVLSNAFMNLCVNAVDAMPESGTLTLRSRNVEPGWIEIVVEDTGVGMPKEVLDKAMDPFFTTKEVGKGTGLGLSMVYSAIKAHQGKMEIHSEPGKGTRVVLRLPACQEGALPSRPANAPAPAAATGQWRVLLVDDDELIQNSMGEILELMGHQVSIARMGEEALAKLEDGFEPDLIILDMNMPGLGGAGTLPRIRAQRPAVPILLSTGRVDQTAQALASSYPKVTLMSKPFGVKELRRQFQSLGLG